MIEDAKRYVALFDPSRLTLAREIRRLNQKDLAHQVGSLTAPAISQFEGGDAKPSAQTLVRIANALQFPVTFFTRATSVDASERHAFFRSLRKTSVRELNYARAIAKVVSLFLVKLEEHVELPELDIHERDLPPTAEKRTVERAAAELRTRWEIPVGPIDDVVGHLERHGIVVARLPQETENIDAFSVFFETRPLVVLSEDNAADRSRFDASHELGHLVMHRKPNAQEHTRIEKQAHWFAAAFLAPPNEIAGELPDHVDWRVFADLKRRWGVSMSSLLMRARDLKRISDGEYVQAMKFMSMKGWRKKEPVTLAALERPTLLWKAAEVLAKHGVTMKSIAEEAGLPDQLVESIVGASGEQRPKVTI